MSLRQDPTASTQVIAIMVAGVIFMGAVGTLFLVTRDSGGDHSAADSASQTIEAGSLADVLLGSPGVGWSAGADHVGRLGIGATNGSGLEQSSIDALRGAYEASSSNGRVDYEDAQRSLGLDPAAGQDFHIRIYPIGIDPSVVASQSQARVAYIGDWTSLASVTIPLGTAEQMAVSANVQLNNTMFANTYRERDALDASTGLHFNNRIYLTTGAVSILVDQPFPLPDLPLYTVLGVPLVEGDVYPDVKAYLTATLPGRLSQYDVLVVGSGVDHSSLTPNAIKDAIGAWVLGGGTLIVLGSSSQSYEWLQPIFHAGTRTVNGAPVAPDVSHPLLHQPNDLNWPSYNNFGRGWDIKESGSGAHYNDFNHIIVAGGEDVLALSNEGAFGDGRVILTTYMPRDIAATLGAAEAQHFFENVIALEDYSHLYLEYGATMPLDVPVSVAVRQSWLWDDTLGQVPVRMELHVWG